MDFDRSVGAVYVPPFGKSLYGPTKSVARPQEPSTRTQRPMVTGTSVLAIRHATGVVLAADTLGSYGSLARYRTIERIKQVSATTVMAGGGDLSDLQEIEEILKDLALEDYVEDDGNAYTPREVHRYLTRVMYNSRSKMDPLWNEMIIAGVDEDNKPFLGQCDLYGTSFEDTTLATGYGAHIARPLLREQARDDLTEEEAVKVIEDCMRVMFYRDARTINNIQVARISAASIAVSEPYSLETEWNHGEGHGGH